MSLHTLFLILAAIGILVVLPIVLVVSVIQHIRHKPSERKGGGSASNAIGGAMLELDRFTRPAAEHHIQAEHQNLKREDDQDGE